MPRDTGSSPDPLASIATIRSRTKPTGGDSDMSAHHLLATAQTDSEYEAAERRRAAAYVRRALNGTASEVLDVLGLGDVPEDPITSAVAVDLVPALRRAVHDRDRVEVARILRPLERHELYAVALVLADLLAEEGE